MISKREVLLAAAERAFDGPLNWGSTLVIPHTDVELFLELFDEWYDDRDHQTETGPQRDAKDVEYGYWFLLFCAEVIDEL